MPTPYRVCFVCTGNICRSPTAEVVFNELVTQRGLAGKIVADSAATDRWELGEPIDRRAQETLCANGYDPSGHIARLFEPEWFAQRDLVIALASDHLRTLRSWADEPDLGKVHLLRSFDRAANPGGDLATGDGNPALSVADPYYGGMDGFALAFEQIESACEQLLDWIVDRLDTQ